MRAFSARFDLLRWRSVSLHHGVPPVPFTFRSFDCKMMDYRDPLFRTAHAWMDSPVLRGLSRRLGGAAAAAAAVVSALFLLRYFLHGA
jgi:hypothetical protein